MEQREIIFRNKKLVTIYVCSTLHEKTEFLQERTILLGCLNIPLW